MSAQPPANNALSSVERVAEAVTLAVISAPTASPEELRRQISQVAQYGYNAGIADGYSSGFEACRAQLRQRITSPNKSGQRAA